MDVQLSPTETTALRQALQSYLSDLRMEITDTDNPAYRRNLREERAALESVADKLAEAAKASDERDAEGRIVFRLVGVWVD